MLDCANWQLLKVKIAKCFRLFPLINTNIGIDVYVCLQTCRNKCKLISFQRNVLLYL